eukprot:scaffold31190_cov41-Phaeocystis_antarctica.AAC.2
MSVGCIGGGGGTGRYCGGRAVPLCQYDLSVPMGSVCSVRCGWRGSWFKVPLEVTRPDRELICSQGCQ